MLASRSLRVCLQVSLRPLSSSVWSCNEWDPLEEVIVGRPEFGVVPRLTPEVSACVMPDKRSFFERHVGRYWSDALPAGHWHRVLEEVAELCRVLRGEGVTVKRPDAVDWAAEFRLADGLGDTAGLYGAMPRDSLLIVADEIVEAGMAWRSRFFEYRAYRSLVVDYWRRGAKWTTAPKPTGRHLQPDGAEFATGEAEPCFDAADFLRAGRDLFAQRSQVTNLAGIEWLRRHLEPRGIRVHRLRFRDPRPMHIDATFAFVRPGLAMQNPQRPLTDRRIFDKAGWRLVDCPAPAAGAQPKQLLGSRWLCMNTLMLDQSRVLVEREETPVQRFYESLGVTPVPVSMRHCHSIGGGLHCWTVDVRRRGELMDYF